MKFSHKLAKLTDSGSLLLSAKRKLSSKLHPLPVERFLKEINPAELQRIREAYGVKHNTSKWPKYADAETYLKANIGRVQDIGIDRSPRPLHILDVGSGAGYFLFVCKVLGHSGFGLDLPEPKLYEEMFQLFGLKRAMHRVEKFQPLPETGRKYDFVTAFQIVFNELDKPQPWGAAEWDYFLNDAGHHLLPGGRIYLSLNRQPNGIYYTEEVRKLFVDRGGRIDHRFKILFPPKR